MRSFRYLVKEGFKNVWHNRLMSIASIGVLVAVMVLIGAATILSVNVDVMLENLQEQNVVMVYTTDEATEEQARTAYAEILALENVNEDACEFVTQEEGVQSLIDSMGSQYEELFEFIENDGESKGSWLPFGMRISFDDLTRFDKTIEAISKVEYVDHINDSRDLTMKIINMRSLVNTAGLCIIALLFVTALVIIANTIKITMHSRKLEISIMKAVGATNHFIRTPFVIEGIILGLSSAIVSTFTVYGAYTLVITKVEQMSVTLMPFMDFGLYMFGMFLCLGVVTGVVGSIISIGKYLRKEGSEFRAF